MVKEVQAQGKKSLALLKLRASAANKDVSSTLAKYGAIVENHSDNDYLYITIGPKPREGVALVFEDVAMLVDPNTFEAVGVELPFCLERIAKGELTRWAPLSHWVKRKGSFEISSKDTPKEFRTLVALVELCLSNPSVA